MPLFSSSDQFLHEINHEQLEWTTRQHFFVGSKNKGFIKMKRMTAGLLASNSSQTVYVQQLLLCS